MGGYDPPGPRTVTVQMLVNSLVMPRSDLAVIANFAFLISSFNLLTVPHMPEVPLLAGHRREVAVA